VNPDKMWQDIDDALVAGGADDLPMIYADTNIPVSGGAYLLSEPQRYYAEAVGTKRRARLEILVPLRHGAEWASGIAAHVLQVVRSHVEDYEGGDLTRSKDGRFLQVAYYWPHPGPLPPKGHYPFWFVELQHTIRAKVWSGVRTELTYQRLAREGE
jgi:hypothetical protein